MFKKCFFFLLLVAIYSCGIFGSEPETSKTFGNATKVVITLPDTKCSFFDVEKDRFNFGVKVDSKIEVGISGSKRVVAAIFKTKPQEQAGSLINKEDIVWMWTSGMRSDGRAMEGKLSIVDGVKTNENGEPLDLVSCKVHRDRGDKDAENYCTRLDENGGYKQLYWIAIWGYNEDREISYWTDEPMPFFVKCPADKNDCPKPENIADCK